MPEVSVLGEERKGRKDVTQIVRGFAHPHEDDLFRLRTARSSEHRLRDDFRVGELTNEAALSRHAENAPDGAADLSRNADAFARKQNRLHPLAVGKLQKEPFPGCAGVVRDHADERRPECPHLRQSRTETLRKPFVLDGRPGGASEERPSNLADVFGFGSERTEGLEPVVERGNRRHGKRDRRGVAGKDRILPKGAPSPLDLKLARERIATDPEKRRRFAAPSPGVFERRPKEHLLDLGHQAVVRVRLARTKGVADFPT